MGTSNGGSREKQVGVAAIENGQTEQGRASSSERLWNGVLLAELLTRRERVADLAPRLWGLGGSILGASGGLAAGGSWGKPFNGPRGASSSLQRSETPCSALRRPEMRCEALKCAVPCPAGRPIQLPGFPPTPGASAQLRPRFYCSTRSAATNPSIRAARLLDNSPPNIPALFRCRADSIHSISIRAHRLSPRLRATPHNGMVRDPKRYLLGACGLYALFQFTTQINNPTSLFNHPFSKSLVASKSEPWRPQK